MFSKLIDQAKIIKAPDSCKNYHLATGSSQLFSFLVESFRIMFILLFLVLGLCQVQAIPVRSNALYTTICNCTTRQKCEKLIYLEASCKLLRLLTRTFAILIYTLARIAEHCRVLLSFCNRINSRLGILTSF